MMRERAMCCGFLKTPRSEVTSISYADINAVRGIAVGFIAGLSFFLLEYTM